MLSANSDHEQVTILALTEAELEGISGGWGHGCGQEYTSCGDNQRLAFRGGDNFGFRMSERFDFRSNDNFSYRSSERSSFGDNSNCW